MVATRSRLKEELDERGLAVVEGLLDVEEDLHPVIDEYDGLLDRVARWLHRQGTLSSTHEDLPFGDRLTALLRETDGAVFQDLEISLPQKGITRETPIHHGPAVFRLLSNPKLLDVVEELIGPEIYSNPVQHVRIKPPQERLPQGAQRNGLVSQVVWHQDQGTVREEADDSTMLTVWVPIVDATEENGCLVVAPGSHRRGMNLHCEVPSGAHEIPDRFIGTDRVSLPMRAGDVLFMNKLTMHSSLPNVSDVIRWSFDLRYNPIGEATGRPWFPGFVARSRSDPDSELRDGEAWAEGWREARDRLADRENPKFQRWDSDDPLCA